MTDRRKVDAMLKYSRKELAQRKGKLLAKHGDATYVGLSPTQKRRLAEKELTAINTELQRLRSRKGELVAFLKITQEIA